MTTVEGMTVGGTTTGAVAGFETAWEQTVQDLNNLAASHFRDLKDRAEASAREFLEASKADVARYTRFHSEGRLSRDEYAWLLRARLNSLARMRALTELGKTEVQAQGFVAAILERFLDLVFSLVPIVVSAVVTEVVTAIADKV